MKTNRKILIVRLGMFLFGFMVLVVLLMVSSVSDLKDSDSNIALNQAADDPFFRLTGSTAVQLYDWAEKEELEGRLILSHKRLKQYKNKEPVFMEPNEKYVISIYTEDYDINKLSIGPPKYWEEIWCEFKTPYEELPVPFRKLLDKFCPNDVGKNIGDVVPELEKPIFVCCISDGNVINSEPLEVKVLHVSNDKLSFKLGCEPFSLSTVKGVEIADRKILYTEVVEGKKVRIGMRSRYELGMEAKKETVGKEKGGRL